jgi:hypothetical protein
VDVLLRLEPAMIDGRSCLRGSLSDVGERKRIEHALRNVALGVSGATDRDIFQVIVRYLAETLGVDFAYIGELTCGPPERINTLAVYMDGEIAGNTVYDLANTPCDHVVGKRFYFVPSHVRALYPGDNMLSRMNFELCAYPLFSAGGCAGLIAVTPRAADRQGADGIHPEDLLGTRRGGTRAPAGRCGARAARAQLRSPEDGGHRPPHRRHRARLQQHPHRHHGHIVMAQEWQEGRGDDACAHLERAELGAACP